ncbi:TPA: hypothetical protein N2N45_002412 [Klebsiella aerogenes]|nr:hypothetical protein [Klebsiella aerogenes]
MEMEFDMNSNAVLEAFTNGFADEEKSQLVDDNSEGLYRKEGEKYKDSDTNIPDEYDEGYWEDDEDGNEVFYSDGDEITPVEEENKEDITSLIDADDEYELPLFSDEFGNVTKAKKADVIEAYKAKERYEAMNKIIMDAGKDLQAYEEAVLERVEGTTYQSERIIAECQKALRNNTLTSPERVQAYDTIEREKQKLQMINDHVARTRADREKAEQAANFAKVNSVSHQMMNAYRWDNETLNGVDIYLANNIPNYSPSMLSPELLVMARKAMIADKGKEADVSNKLNKVKNSGRSVNASERAARKAANDKKTVAMRKLKQEQLPASEMFNWLID